MKILIVNLLIFFMSSQCFASLHYSGEGYEYFCLGNCTNIKTETQEGTVLMGGGTDVDLAFLWMIQRSGKGNFVVIRAAGTDAYNPYIYSLGGNGTNIQSVTTLIINSTVGSNNDFVYNTILEADALFIAGGDQHAYVTLWNNTKVQDGIHHLVKRKVPIGGTSAGLHVLGNFIYTAATGGIDSPAALNNPYDPALTIGDEFLHVSPHLKSVITDSHFFQRDRMGRSITFLARILTDYPDHHHHYGISIDEQTAILLEADGIGTVVNLPQQVTDQHAAYFLTPTVEPARCVPNKSLLFNSVVSTRVGFKGRFDFVNWVALDDDNTIEYLLTAKNGNLTSSSDSIY